MYRLLFPIFFLIISFFLLLLCTVKVNATDYIIHTENDVYYYPDIERNETMILPNDEVIDTDDVLDLQANEEPLRTNDGVDLFLVPDDIIFMEGENYGKTD